MSSGPKRKRIKNVISSSEDSETFVHDDEAEREGKRVKPQPKPAKTRTKKPINLFEELQSMKTTSSVPSPLIPMMSKSATETQKKKEYQSLFDVSVDVKPKRERVTKKSRSGSSQESKVTKPVKKKGEKKTQTKIDDFMTSGSSQSPGPSLRKRESEILAEKIDNYLNNLPVIVEDPNKSFDFEKCMKELKEGQAKIDASRAELKEIEEKCDAEEREYEAYREENRQMAKRIVTELTESKLKSLVKANKKFVERIVSGKYSCFRYDQYQKGGKARRNLVYLANTQPFNQDQLKCVLGELEKRWMPNPQDRSQKSEFFYNVVMVELLIKIYQDFFQLETKEEAEKRMKQTPS